MKTNGTPVNALISRANLLRFSMLAAFAGLVIFSLLTVSSASLSPRSVKDKPSDLGAKLGLSSALLGQLRQIADKSRDTTHVGFTPQAVSPLFPFLPQGAEPESVATYQSDCVTPLTNFTVGNTVCAKADGPIIGFQTIYWVDSQGGLVQLDTISANSPSATRLVNVSGNWKVYLASANDGSLRARNAFSVSDPEAPTVDLAVFHDSRSDFTAGGNVLYRVIAFNQGPSTAGIVQLSVPVPNNTTYVSSSQDSGETFNCTPGSPSTICTIASLAPNQFGSFTFIYQVNSGTSTGTEISSTATISSNTEELHAPDNAATASAQVVGGGGGASCTLDCPNNVTATANTTDDGTPQGNPGAIVTFPGADAFGDCGAISMSPASGSFFPVGPTTVFVSSSTGGGSCSFVVTVVGDQAPDITCPANIVTDTTGCQPAEVNPGAPTATPSGLTISGERSDGQALDAPYPVGVTTIIWTATDSGGRADSCTQTITVNSDDTEPPTIMAPADVNIATPADAHGSCGVVIGESELGTPTANDNCTVNVARTGVPTGNFFPVGTTIITYTATDSAGLTATATQNVTVTDGTPPAIFAPADASFVCPSEVPAADPGQATGPDIIVNGQPQPGPPADNCSTTTVTVADTSSGAGSASSPLIITRTYTATDGNGNSASVSQTITVIDDTSPTISLDGPNTQVVECHTSYSDLGATANDNCGGSFAATPSGGVNVNVVGSYTVTYSASDAAGNAGTPVTRTVNVVDTTAPVITLNGASSVTVECHTSFTDPGASAADSCDPSVPVTVSGSVDADVPGSYTLTYSATDGSGNSGAATRTVNVVDTSQPSITFNSLTIFFNNSTIVFNENTVTIDGQTYPYDGVSFSHNGFTFTFNGEAITINGQTYTLEGKALVLWTPTHQYQTVSVNDLIASATDGCDSGVNRDDVVISQVTSDEVVNNPTNSDGNTLNDIVIAANCKSVQLRAERDNQGNGRVYTITSSVRDAAGNTKTVTSKINVRRFLQPAVDSGAQYTVNGNCP